MLLVKKLHKWLSVIVGIQLLIWLGSGLYFNLMDHHKSGGHTYKNHQHQTFVPERQRLVEPKDIIDQLETVVEVKLGWLLQTPVYTVTHVKGLYRHFKNQYSLFDAYSGERIVIDESWAKRLALASYSGPGQITSVDYIKAPLPELPKQKNDSWRVNFDDEIETRVYIEVGSGRVVGHSDSHKAFSDFFFMLHFMDYGNSGGFNHWLIYTFAFAVFALAITGSVWVVQSVTQHQYRIPWLRSNATLTLYSEEGEQLATIVAKTDESLLDVLAQTDTQLQSKCGGGGTCGRCRVILDKNAPITEADTNKLSSDELATGLRLACQHYADETKVIQLATPKRRRSL